MARKTGSHSEITGPKIRLVALRLFARHGYAAVSMRQIAKDVGVQAGALYLYTTDKQNLLFELMFDHLRDLLAAWEQIEAPGTARQQLQAFTRFHIRFHLDRSEAVFISYMELRNLAPDNFAVIQAMRKQYEDVLESILKNGQDTGDLNVPDTKLATMAVIAMLTGVNTWYRDGGRLGPEKIEAIYGDMVVKAVGL